MDFAGQINLTALTQRNEEVVVRSAESGLGRTLGALQRRPNAFTTARGRFDCGGYAGFAPPA